MSLATGRRLGPYEITSQIGVGGMGEVYRATDVNLKRAVAIKVLPSSVSGDPERLARFQREAEVLAALNHPNIAAIYGLEKSDGLLALVIELVEGATLADRIAQGPIVFDEALPIAKQIAEALETAHEQGIIHRDLKPSNIKVRPDGTVKVLDFGLAKLSAPIAVSGGSSTHAPVWSQSPTITTPAMTQAGMILGTAAYMSPEQAKGREVDKRCDIWAFGCLLYEMLTGKRAFAGDDVAETLAAVIRAEPDWPALPANVPATVVLLLQKCLAKSAKTRVSDMSTVRFVLDSASMASGPAARAASQTRTRRRVLLAGTSVLACILTGAAVWEIARAGVEAPAAAVTRFSIQLPADQGFGNGGVRLVAISPDGSRIAYADRRQIYIRSLADDTLRAVPGANVDLSGAGASTGMGLPTFSPDGESLAFFTAERTAELLPKGTIKRVRLDGSRSVTLCEATLPIGLAWTPDGIVFGQFSQGIVRVSENGGTPEVLVSTRENNAALHPQLLPGGRAVLFTEILESDLLTKYSGALLTLANQRLAYDEVWSKGRIVVQSLATHQSTVLIEGATDARYVASGHLVYLVRGALYAAPFDVDRLSITGTATPVLQGVGRARFGPTDMGAAHFDVSQNGSIVYLAGPVSFDAALVRDVAVVRAGNVKRLSLPAMPYEFPALSPDGKALALSADDGKSSNVWVYDLSATGPPRQLTFQGRNRFPIWSEDGKRITFQSDREGDLALFSQAADGGEAAVRLTTPEAGAAHVPHAWSPDGASLLFSVELPQATFSLWAFNNRGHTSTRVETVRPSTVMPAGAFSPDGKLVAYQAGELGQVHIAVQPFPVTGAQWTFPNTNSRHPRWSRDGSRLFLTRGPDLIQVDIARQPAFRFLNTTTVMTAQAGQTFGPMYPNYDVWMDDSFITPITAEGVMSGSTLAIRQVNVVLNWLEELKRLVPTN